MSVTYRNALPEGTQIAEFVLKSVLGSGGFGITYLAWDTKLQVNVAIKEYLPSDLAVRERDYSVHAKSDADETNYQWGLQRFLEEAQTLARFEEEAGGHDCIVRVKRFLEANHTAYFVMRYYDGESLRAVLDESQVLEEEQLRELVLPLLEGLELVHKAGVLHRDIKPQNIYVRRNGSPVLLDFGAARQMLGERSKSMTSVLTPPYAPIEQHGRTGKQGAWTDIYALGVVMYEALSGIQPPDATDRVLEDQLQPLSKVARGRCSKTLIQGVEAALKVKAAERPQTVEQWRRMLWSQKPDPRPAPPPTESRGGIWRAIMGLVVGVVVWQIGAFLLSIPVFILVEAGDFGKVLLVAAITLSGLPAGYVAAATSRRPALFGLIVSGAGLVGGVVDLGMNWHDPDWRYLGVYRDLFFFPPGLSILVGGYLRARRAEYPAVQRLAGRSVIGTIIGVIGAAVIMTVAIVLPERLRPHFTTVFEVPDPALASLGGIVVAGDDIWVADSKRGSVSDLRASDATERWMAKVGDGWHELAFDGANIWVTNVRSVTKLRARDGTVLGAFDVGRSPAAMAFDGVSLWVANNESNNVTKLRATDGKVLGTFGVGEGPRAIAFDGANIWVANRESNNVTKLRAMDGRVLGTFAVGARPDGLAFDGTNMWITSFAGDGVTKLRCSDGMKLGTFDVGAGFRAIAFDGTNLWLTSQGGVDVTKLRATDGVKVGTYRFGHAAWHVVIDGKNVWVANYWIISKRTLAH